MIDSRHKVAARRDLLADKLKYVDEGVVGKDVLNIPT
jgi:hypothetical protein